MGVGVFDDLDRYWNFAVLKGPDAKGAWHRYEIKAMSEGVWGGEETRMDRTVHKRSAEWSWGQAVDLALSFAPDRVEGVARDAKTGAELYRGVLVPRNGAELPVPAGRPCLFVSGEMRGRVENVEWTVEDEVPEQTRAFPAYRTRACAAPRPASSTWRRSTAATGRSTRSAAPRSSPAPTGATRRARCARSLATAPTGAG